MTTAEFLTAPPIRPPQTASEMNGGGSLDRRLCMIVSKRPLPTAPRWLSGALLCSCLLLPLGGTYAQDPNSGRLVRMAGFRDCVSVQGSATTFDVNTAEPALLLSVGVSPPAVDAIVARRQQRPFRNPNELSGIRRIAGPGGGRLEVGGIAIYTLRATARHRLPTGQLSDMQRSVAATIKLVDANRQPPYDVLRWYDNAPTDAVNWPQ